MGLKRQKAVRGRAEFARQANGELEDLQCNNQRRSQGGTLVHVLPVVGVIFYEFLLVYSKITFNGSFNDDTVLSSIHTWVSERRCRQHCKRIYVTVRPRSLISFNCVCYRFVCVCVSLVFVYCF